MSGLESRFWAKVAIGAPDECWPWTAHRNEFGYGKFQVGRKSRTASRVAWEIANGRPVPAGLIVRHTCDNPPCVNPAHLLIGTQSDNSLDQVERGRHPEARRTHCAQGHPFAGDNLKIYQGQRACAECKRAASRASMQRFRAKRRAHV